MNKKRTIVTVTGIRPDFIRMSSTFKLLDEHFNHVMVHTGQHFDRMLSDVFFEDLNIRKPDINLSAGGSGKEHFHQTAETSIKLIEALRSIGAVDLVVYLGDSNSAATAVAAKKEGYKIAHIEAGMRSYDRRMLEEINRVVCDHCSDLLFVYHQNYAEKLYKEGITNNVYVVGNTILESLHTIGIPNSLKNNSHIILDIHRPENFKCKTRMENILKFANQCGVNYNTDIHFLNFTRTIKAISEHNIDLAQYDKIKIVSLMSYRDFILSQYHSKFIISDSGTAQEEPCLLGTPVIVPRDFTERPESVISGCSLMVNANNPMNCVDIHNFLYNFNPDISWLGNGNASVEIIKAIKKFIE
jgi:UDP-N-acetylglucosamine 2-epimerase